MITRRDALALLGTAAAAGVAMHSLPAWAQGKGAAASVEELAQPGPLGDVWLGPQDAKVTVIEYASLTCSHCAAFHEKTWPDFKTRYIDSGKVRFTLREFPLDPLATAGFMLARCQGNDKYFPISDLLFDRQRAWAFVEKPLDALQQMMRQAGFSQEKFESCLKDQKLYDAVNAVKNRGMEKFKVDSTPTFFINGQRYPGAISIDELDKILTPLLGA
jgi:protein-disulfide isomerase